MSQILGFLGAKKLASTGVFTDDDLVDRLNHDYTSVVMVVLAVIISTRHYVGDQIQCWVPGYFTGTYVDYTGKVCWVTNTYHVPFDQHLAKSEDALNTKKISYYQWVHMVLIIQALFFYAPCVIWRSYNSCAGINLNNLIQASRKLCDPDKKEATTGYIVRHVDRYLSHYKDLERGTFARLKVAISRVTRIMCGKKYGNYLAILYLCIKFIYACNVFIQFVFLNLFLGADFHLYGLNIIRHLMAYEDWPVSGVFPRVTICDFKVRQLGGNVHRYTVQCVLPINFFNEKIYLLIWFWLIVIGTLSICSMFVWAYRILWKGARVQFIRLHLQTAGKVDTDDVSPSTNATVNRFTNDYLREDGVMVMRLIGLNTDAIVVAEVLGALWSKFSEDDEGARQINTQRAKALAPKPVALTAQRRRDS